VWVNLSGKVVLHLGGDELMKRLKLMVAAVAMLGFAFSSIPAYAGGLAPGEGMYIGAFVGHGAGHVSAKVASEANGSIPAQTSELKDGGLGLSGFEGGGWVGYGYKMGDAYIGFEVDAAGGGGKFELTSDSALDNPKKGGALAKTLTKASAEIQWTAGVGGRLGVYLNEDTLFAVKGGMQAAEFDVTFGGDSDTYTSGGPRVSASLDSRISAIDPNLSLRVEYNFTDYMTSAISGIGSLDTRGDKADSEVSGQHYSGRVGITYSFFDASSLF